MAPVATFGKNGFLVQIGTGHRAVKKFVKVHVYNISADGKESDELGGCHNGRIIRNCRQCLDVATTRLVIRSESDIKHRPDNEHEFVVQRMEEVWKLRISAAAQNQRHIMTEDQKALETKFKSLDLTQGRNPLYRLFYYFNGKGIAGFHQSLYPDRLHVILKGIVEKTISWSLSIVYNIMQMDGKASEYNQSMNKLDKRIAAFPTHQAYECFRYNILYLLFEFSVILNNEINYVGAICSRTAFQSTLKQSRKPERRAVATLHL